MALAEVAVAQAKAGQRAAAKQTFERARQTAQQVADAYWRAKALTEIAVAQAKAGQRAAAKQTFERALQIAQMTKDAFQRVTILSAIATKQAEAGQFDWALQTAQAIKGTYWRTKTLQAIAELRAGAKRRARTRHPRWNLIDAYSPDEVAYARTLSQADAGHLDQALQSAQEIVDAFFRASALAVVASGQAKAGQVRQARDTVAEALQAAQKIKSPRTRALALAHIAAVQAEAGQIDQALQTAKQLVSDPAEYARALLDIAAVLLGVSEEEDE